MNTYSKGAAFGGVVYIGDATSAVFTRCYFDMDVVKTQQGIGGAISSFVTKVLTLRSVKFPT